MYYSGFYRSRTIRTCCKVAFVRDKPNKVSFLEILPALFTSGYFKMLFRASIKVVATVIPFAKTAPIRKSIPKGLGFLTAHQFIGNMKHTQKTNQYQCLFMCLTPRLIMFYLTTIILNPRQCFIINRNFMIIYP